MTQAIHHVQLNEKLQQCYDILDSIQKTYRNYNGEYIQLVQAHPQTMNNFFDAYEADILSNFKIYRIERKAEIEELLKQETERKQAKLEKAALKKLEQEQKAEEAKRAAEEAKGVKPTGKAPAKAQAKGKGGKDEKPVLDVPQLEVPKVIPYKSEMGNDYIKEGKNLDMISKICWGTFSTKFQQVYLSGNLKLAEAILSSYDKWIASSSSVAYFSTLNIMMDELTDGRFSVMYFYNTVEQKILRRINVNSLIGEAFDSKNHKGTETLKEFLAKIGIAFDGPYLSTYVGTLLRISNHILVRERAMYLSLAEKLQLPPNPLIIQDSPDFNEVIAVSKFTVTDHQTKIIEDQFIQNSNQEFMEKLNNMNLSNINFNIRSI